jgi:hypothetical protein
MVDNHLVVWLAWFDVEDSLGKRAVTLDGSQAYRERQVRSHEHGSDYVSRSGRRLLREGTGNGKGKGGQNNCLSQGTARLYGIVSRPRAIQLVRPF